MTSLGLTLMENNVMEAGCVMSSSLTDILFAHLRKQEKKYSNVFSYVLQAAL